MPGNLPPGKVVPGNLPPGKVVPGNVVPGRVVPGSEVPGSMLVAELFSSEPLPGRHFAGLYLC